MGYVEVIESRAGLYLVTRPKSSTRASGDVPESLLLRDLSYEVI